MLNIWQKVKMLAYFQKKKTYIYIKKKFLKLREKAKKLIVVLLICINKLIVWSCISCTMQVKDPSLKALSFFFLGAMHYVAVFCICWRSPNSRKLGALLFRFKLEFMFRQQRAGKHRLHNCMYRKVILLQKHNINTRKDRNFLGRVLINCLFESF